jgi:AraC-like DNA-binding protein
MVSKTGRRVTGTAGELLLVPSGDWHRDDYDEAQEFPRVFLLFFSWKAEAQFWKLFPRSERGTLLVPINRDIAGMFDRIQTTLSSGTQADEIIVRTYVLTILLLIARTRQPDNLCHPTLLDASVRRQQTIMLAAKQFMDQHYREFISLDRVAMALKISPSYLSHVFSRENDFTLFEYLTDLRMRQARLLLQEGNRSVQEIASAVGYDNVSYFSKAFHRHFGVPPRAMLGAPFACREPANRRRRYGNRRQ